MKFGPAPPARAEGALLAHAIRGPGLSLGKGDRITRTNVEALARAAVADVVVAELEQGDVGENEAAETVAGWLAGANLRCDPAVAGRCNIIAAQSGVLVRDREASTTPTTATRA